MPTGTKDSPSFGLGYKLPVSQRAAFSLHSWSLPHPSVGARRHREAKVPQIFQYGLLSKHSAALRLGRGAQPTVLQ